MISFNTVIKSDLCNFDKKKARYFKYIKPTLFQSIYEHKFNFEETSILAYNEHGRRRKIWEVIEIMKRREYAANFKTDCGNLHLFYFSLTKKYRWIRFICINVTPVSV